MSKRLIVLLAGVVAVAAVIAGCGSSSSDNISKAEFIKQGDALCKKGSSEIETEVKAYAKENNISLKAQPSEAQLEAISENVIIPAIQKQLDGLKALGTPKEGEDEADELFAALEEGSKREKKTRVPSSKAKGRWARPTSWPTNSASRSAARNRHRAQAIRKGRPVRPFLCPLPG